MADTRVLNGINQFQKKSKTAPSYEGASMEHRGKAVDPIRFSIARSATPEEVLTFWVNPSESQWRIGLRTSIEKISGGAVHHEWPQFGVGSQPQDTLFDQPQVSFTFQSGIITPYGYDDLSNSNVRGDDKLPPGLSNFYQFLELLGQSNMGPRGEPNYINMMYTSTIFPSIWLQGFFTEEGVQWTDSAENANTVSWGATLVVFQSYPALDKNAELRSSFQSLGFRSAMNRKK